MQRPVPFIAPEVFDTADAALARVQAIYAQSLNHLREAGARDVVPEIFEASLSLASQTLHHIGVPARRVRRLVQSQRQTRYAGLKEDTSHSAQ